MTNRINILSYTHAVEDYSAVKRNRQHLYSIMLSNKSHPPPKYYILYDLIYMKFQKSQSYNSESKQVSGQLEQRNGKKEWTADRCQGTFRGDRNVLYRDHDVCCTTVHICQVLSNHAFWPMSSLKICSKEDIFDMWGKNQLQCLLLHF